MTKTLQVDLRQTKEWGEYLSSIGWTVETVDGIILLIRQIKWLQGSFIKIQHPVGKIPFSKIDQIARRYHAWLVLIEPHSRDFIAEEYKKHGYKLSSFRMTHSATIFIDLTQSEKKLWLSLSENARRNIRKSQAHNLTIKSVFLATERDDQEFRKFYDLLTNLGKIKKFYIPGYSDYFKKMTALKKQSIILFAYQKGSLEPIAAIWLVAHSERATYLQTGITNLGYQTMANYLLVWEGLKLLKAQKIPTFDFEAIFDERYPKDHPRWENFTEFKKRFHGTIVKYPPSYLKCYSLLLRIYFQCQRLFLKS